MVAWPKFVAGPVSHKPEARLLLLVAAVPRVTVAAYQYLLLVEGPSAPVELSQL
jgi:hypothetical protein